MPTQIGCNTPYYYHKIKSKYKKCKYFIKRYMKIRKAKYYKHRDKFLKKKKIYKKNKRKRNITDCQCYICKEIGHLANQCPAKFNKKKFELGDDGEELFNDNELLEINKFVEIEDISSDESIFIYADKEYEISSEDE